MKVIEKFEVEYVIPETEEEQLEIKRIIADFEKKGRKINLRRGKVIDNSQKQTPGYWKKTGNK
jgi:hypothetical protein